MTIADSEPVKKIRKGLKDAGLANNVVELDVPMENAADTAKGIPETTKAPANLTGTKNYCLTDN